MLDSSLRDAESATTPFTVGRIVAAPEFVHVLDELTLDVVLSELDTVSDFIAYLDKKEAYLTQEQFHVVAAGEEQLLATYLKRLNPDGEHDFTNAEPGQDGVAFLEGIWEERLTNRQYLAKREADQISYAWDRLIEHLLAHGDIPESASGIRDLSDMEKALRTMAAEPRIRRRQLAASLLNALQREVPAGKKFARLGVSDDFPDIAYVFLIAPRPTEDETYEEYREYRKALLLAYCKVAKLIRPHANTVVGLATEPHGTKGASEDLCLLDVGPTAWTPEVEADAKHIREVAELWLEKNVERHEGRDDEFPEIAETRVSPLRVPTTAPKTRFPHLNRAERRRLGRERRRRH